MHILALEVVYCTKYVHIKIKEYHSECPSSELGLSQPFLASECSPSPRNRGEGAHLPAGGGVGGSPNSDEGHTLWYSLYVRTLWYIAKYFGSAHYVSATAEI
jgi:hypothetical protein